MNISNEVLESVLKKSVLSSLVERVLSSEVEMAVPQGENFFSLMYRVRMVVALANGRTAKRSVVVKKIPSGKVSSQHALEWGVFETETLTYLILFKEMEALMNDFGDTEEPLWCKMYHYEPFTMIILEDLKASKFRNAVRQEYLDLDHAELVLRGLGRFHAMSKVLEERGIDMKDSKSTHYVNRDDHSVKKFVHYPLQLLAEAMEESWGPEWKDKAKALKEITLELLIKATKLTRDADPTRFNCVNHGDCWSNNLMFKYDWNNRPFSVRFVDFQFAHYNTPSYDVTQFLYTCLVPKIRRGNRDRLIQSYLHTVNSTLDFYGYEGQRPNKADLEDVLIIKVFSMVLALPVTSSGFPGALDMELFLKTNGTDGINSAIYDERYKRECTPDILELVETLTEWKSSVNRNK